MTAALEMNVGKQLRILFLGAGKRLSLLERFRAAAEAESVQLDLLSVESDIAVPVRDAGAEVIAGPAFTDSAFGGYLLDLVASRGIDLVIPNMDSATTALSPLREPLARLGADAVVSDEPLCAAMEDKVAAAEWFERHDVPIPAGGEWPRIVKHRRGFGSKDQAVVEKVDELEAFFARRSRADYVVQPIVCGQEYTVDAYVDRRGRLIGALSRQRLAVSAGEVDHSRTHRHAAMLNLTRRILACPGWRGPITLQFIDAAAGPVMLEINPRFGGGVTHAIHCGLDMPRWILRERLGLPVEPFDGWADGSIMTRCRRDVFL